MEFQKCRSSPSSLGFATLSTSSFLPSTARNGLSNLGTNSTTKQTTTRKTGKQRISRRQRPRPTMTLPPKDCSWRSERDLRAIESEFYVTTLMSSSGNVVDEDMNRLRRRMVILSQKEKQWSDFCQQFASLSVMTGIPMVNSDTGAPTSTAWILLSVSAVFPLYTLSVLAQWLHNSSDVLQQTTTGFF